MMRAQLLEEMGWEGSNKFFILKIKAQVSWVWPLSLKRGLGVSLKNVTLKLNFHI